MNTTTQKSNKEIPIGTTSGWLMLPISILIQLSGVGLVILSIMQASGHRGAPNLVMLFGGLLTIVFSIILYIGFFTLQPNEARVLILFGEYKGTVRKSGFHWANPFYTNGKATIQAALKAEENTASRKNVYTPPPGAKYRCARATSTATS